MPAGAAAVLPRVGSLVEGPAFHPQLSGRANLARLRRRGPHRGPGHRRGPDRRRAGAGRPAGRRAQALPGLLAGHEAAAGHRRRPAAAARPDDPRRAHQRARPAGHPGGAQPDQGDRGRGHHRVRVLAPARRGRADLHARRRDAHRPAGVPGHAGRTAGPRRGPDPGPHRRAGAGRQGPGRPRPGRRPVRTATRPAPSSASSGRRRSTPRWCTRACRWPAWKPRGPAWRTCSSS